MEYLIGAICLIGVGITSYNIGKNHGVIAAIIAFEAVGVLHDGNINPILEKIVEGDL